MGTVRRRSSRCCGRTRPADGRPTTRRSRRSRCVPHTALAPVSVFFYDAELLAPPELHGPDLEAWLSAPIGGESLVRRLLEPLVGLPVASVEVAAGRVAAALGRLLARRPAFGRARLPFRRSRSSREAPGGLLLLPATGLIDADIGALMRRAQMLGGGDVVCAHLLRGAPGTTPPIVAVPPGCRSGMPFYRAGTARDVATALVRRADVVCWHEDQARGGLIRPSGNAAQLRYLARDALTGSLERVGRLRGDLLVGPRAWLSPRALVTGPAALGAGSYVAPNATLGPGAVIGERCYVGAGAYVRDAVVLDGSIVERGSSLIRGVLLGTQWYPSD